MALRYAGRFISRGLFGQNRNETKKSLQSLHEKLGQIQKDTVNVRATHEHMLLARKDTNSRALSVPKAIALNSAFLFMAVTVAESISDQLSAESLVSSP